MGTSTPAPLVVKAPAEYVSEVMNPLRTKTAG
jgi:hypothetical protein